MKKLPVWFWVVGALFLIWNAFGCYVYLVDMRASDAVYLERYGEDMLAARALYPTWATAFYALAVWSGLLASLLLLLRRKWCVPLFMLSLVAAIICFIPNFTDAALQQLTGSTYWVMPVVVVIIGVVQIWFSRRESAKGTLR
ncbi:hypothetical protein ACFFUB_08805 [Algimonas porphyrae]|uniref:Sugar transporter n=1 Tax=Algimonas porphyrae TaxID=1128113 RepID=A0ABQ5V2Y5_9PROT|nr:hypothetical protein [Algimonas porphyrae]GLQ21888.1 hypothetical protein GCM10007854_28430 [Algimonas porphyrae]